jgi:uncharacterized protein (TIGR00255 family)
MSALEVPIKRRISNRLSRGRVDVTVSLERSGEVEYELNRPLIAGFVHAMQSMQQEFHLTGEPDINVIARIPGALQPVRDSLDDVTISAVESVIDDALDELEEMRQREGAALKSDLAARLDAIQGQVPLIEQSAGTLVEQYRQRLNKRINELVARDGQSIEVDAGRLAQEVAYLADRSDISEEIGRLKSHLEQFRETIESEGEVGKRLDFLLQELNREANTVLSKSTDMAIKEAALSIKGEVEKLREQVQNVE